MKKLTLALLKLIQSAESLGLNDLDVKIAHDYLIHNEPGLCFDSITTQMYESDILIDDDFYKFLCDVGESMKLSASSYLFMKELIRK